MSGLLKQRKFYLDLILKYSRWLYLKTLRSRSLTCSILMILMVSSVTCRELIELKTDENVIVIVPLTLACKSMIIYKQNVVNNIT